jgi:hypothetical protein
VPSPTRWKIAVACLFVMAVVAAGVLVLVGVIDTNPTDMGSNALVQKTAAVAATRPTTTYTNAADAYREAATLTDAIYSDEWGRYEEGNFDKDAAAFFAKNGRVADLLRAGAASPSCDWGGPLADTHVSLNALRTAANFTVARARFARVNGDPAGAMDDLLAAMALGRHVGKDGLMIDKLVELGMEQYATKYIAAILPSLNQEQLRALLARIESLPKSSTGQQIMAAEMTYGGKKSDSVDSLYRAMSDAWNSPQPEFARIVDAKMDELKLDTSDRKIGSTTILLHEPLAVTDAQRAMLLTAIDILERGEIAVRESHDPLGSGPLGYVKTAKGFELTSEYKQKDQPVKLVVGE